MAEQPLRLSAEDVDDLTVISACLQDAIARAEDFAYHPQGRRFAAVFSRYTWEEPQNRGRGGQRRVRAGIHFDGVLAVKFRGLRQDSDEVLELLSIGGEKGEDGGAVIVLEFAGGSAIQLEVECVACYLSDIGRPWRTRRRPEHPHDAD